MGIGTRMKRHKTSLQLFWTKMRGDFRWGWRELREEFHNELEHNPSNPLAASFLLTAAGAALIPGPYLYFTRGGWWGLVFYPELFGVTSLFVFYVLSSDYPWEEGESVCDRIQMEERAGELREWLKKRK